MKIEKKVKLKDRLIFTAKVIMMASLPVNKETVEPVTFLPFSDNGFAMVTPEAQLLNFKNLRSFTNSKQQLRLFLSGCLMPAAPFLLFRLKRQGFSHCLARATGEGIYISAEP